MKLDWQHILILIAAPALTDGLSYLINAEGPLTRDSLLRAGLAVIAAAVALLKQSPRDAAANAPPVKT
jgi:hypothetical protein